MGIRTAGIRMAIRTAGIRMAIRTAGIRMAIRTAVIYKLLHGMVFQSMTSYAAYLLSLMPLCTRVPISTSIARPV